MELLVGGEGCSSLAAAEGRADEVGCRVPAVELQVQASRRRVVGRSLRYVPQQLRFSYQVFQATAGTELRTDGSLRTLSMGYPITKALLDF